MSADDFFNTIYEVTMGSLAIIILVPLAIRTIRMFYQAHKEDRARKLIRKQKQEDLERERQKKLEIKKQEESKNDSKI